MGNMYRDAKTWSPFVGCKFACTYCVPTFKRQAKRQRNNCLDCYDYRPHEHPERLSRIPSAEIVFCCAYGDIAFASPEYRIRIAKAIADHAARRRKRMEPPRTYYLQSKSPVAFTVMLPHIPPEVVLVTTLETNIEAGYRLVSRAPGPIVRAFDFAKISWPRKVVTIEPLLDFGVGGMMTMLGEIKPEYVWMGFNSKPKHVFLPEPSPDKVLELAAKLKAEGILVRAKALRGLVLP